MKAAQICNIISDVLYYNDRTDLKAAKAQCKDIQSKFNYSLNVCGWIKDRN